MFSDGVVGPNGRLDLQRLGGSRNRVGCLASCILGVPLTAICTSSYRDGGMPRVLRVGYRLVSVSVVSGSVSVFLDLRNVSRTSASLVSHLTRESC